MIIDTSEIIESYDDSRAKIGNKYYFFNEYEDLFNSVLDIGTLDRLRDDEDEEDGFGSEEERSAAGSHSLRYYYAIPYKEKDEEAPLKKCKKEVVSEKDISVEELIEDPIVKEIVKKILKESIDKINKLYEVLN